MATVDEARLTQIEGRLKAGYTTYNVAQGLWEMQQDIAALVPALREARARVELAGRMVALLDRIAELEDGTERDRWAAIPLHGELGTLVGEWHKALAGGGDAG